jgi:hypothetical protein
MEQRTPQNGGRYQNLFDAGSDESGLAHREGSAIETSARIFRVVSTNPIRGRSGGGLFLCLLDAAHGAFRPVSLRSDKVLSKFRG